MDALPPRTGYSFWALDLDSRWDVFAVFFSSGMFSWLADCSPPLCCSPRCPQTTDKGPVIRISVNQTGGRGLLQFCELRFTFSKTMFFAQAFPNLNVTTARKMTVFNITCCINLLKVFTSCHLFVNIPDLNVMASWANSVEGVRSSKV